ncbi:UDP-N-acetylmuramoyl-L-alanyl-D-glutamate--2,6-diaminopimelate ligase [Candidatus Ichthyocystis hellenicum]|uniref:UDP-N-acetylmuramoyl-L-alanyl-D-glutamate--2, 6-diaminopimelate ligase n=1 Tax=Candidatus Ichthyocystis hellenicum TaxID=1561003 RepID=UPI000A87854C|nr:UDP-N-acetylmuramoyl-L-alanyl-D-glutamate--2,6-diaminopimelate ligase [Candidatus Ichthyocystis hellenicum]
MNVSTIFEQLLYQGVSSVERMSSDSREVQIGDIFLAYPGISSDGRCYLHEAVDRGCAAVIYENSDNFVWPEDILCPHVGCSGIVEYLGEIAQHVYQHPSSRLHITAVTGTNGKTTTVSWLSFLYDRCNCSGASIGTLGWGKCGNLRPHGLTTPNTVSLHSYLSYFENHGITHVALEASSIGLEQRRLQGIDVDVVVLTNLQTDHLDYHKTNDNYARSKELLFSRDFNCAVVNGDDPFGRFLNSSYNSGRSKWLTFGINPEFDHDVTASDITISDTGIVCKISVFGEEMKVTLPIYGRHSLSNFLAVLSVLVVQGLQWRESLFYARELPGLPGRFEPIHGEGDDCFVWVDYAHTPDAMAIVLNTLRSWMCCDQRLICIFGCGGERDRLKRSQMGAVACSCADQVILTNDNPRGEDSVQIINDILPGCCNSPFVSVIYDRYDAIMSTILSVHAGDVVVIMGKGHENYQEIGSVRYLFSDQVVASQALARRKR